MAVNPVASLAITSTRSPRVVAARRLATRAFRAKQRLFLAEGPQAVREAIEYASITELYVNRAAEERYGDLLDAAARANGITYNRFIQGLKAANVEVDRKILADLAVHDAGAFAALVEVAQKALPADVNAPKVAA